MATRYSGIAMRMCAGCGAFDWLPACRPAVPVCVTTTTLSRTVIRPERAAVLALAETVNVTGLSPLRGMPPAIVIHGTSDVALHTQRSCVALPHVIGSLC